MTRSSDDDRTVVPVETGAIDAPGEVENLATLTTVPDEATTVIVRNVNRVVTERRKAAGNGRRDVHVKHHGLLWGWFKVDDDLDDDLAKGVFQKGASYPVWIRFSSSSKKAQSDLEPDGRGIAVKLLGVKGDRLLSDSDAQKDTQDFIMLNGPAFFARHAQDMAVVSELEAKDEFPSTFFVHPSRLAGLRALMQMAGNQADSPLALTYYSQTPYQLGARASDDREEIKYRLRPLRVPPEPDDQRAPKLKGANYLFNALQRLLRPDPEEIQALQAVAKSDPRYEELSHDNDAVFRFEVQRRNAQGNFPLDDATVVWNEADSKFAQVGELHIPRQEFDTQRRMSFAESISFNPWNGLQEHEPLASLNIARRFVYRASLAARTRLNLASAATQGAQAWTADYSIAEWQRLRARTNDAKYEPPMYSVINRPAAIQLIDAVLPRFFLSITRFWETRWGFLLAPLLLAGIVWYGTQYDSHAACGPFMIGSDAIMPSERAIPPEQFSSPYQGTPFADKLDERMRDIRWVFRYAPIGTEFGSGIPYWIYRALPSMFPDYFERRPDWSAFGFQQRDDTDYYANYHDLPRGLVLSDTVVHFGGSALGVRLKRVSLNCASCHRGEYLDNDGVSHFVDGMPNIVLDAAKFKQKVFLAFSDKEFTADRVMDAIDKIMMAEHDANPKLLDGSPRPSALTVIERQIYRAIVEKVKDESAKKSIAWMDHRPDNGPGRLDAFGALRYEFLKYRGDCVWNSPGCDSELATVDLPSIWNQGTAWRPWHHYDGNTNDGHARNVGAIVGVGGTSFSIHLQEVVRVGDWLDSDPHSASAPGLEAPKYPWYLDLNPHDIDAGRQIYESTCSSCHGYYDGNRKLIQRSTRVGLPCDAGTDELRAHLVDKTFVTQLNEFGTEAGLWHTDSFRSSGGKYLCPPLDGIWARAPYLHNGSVPTLWHLLSKKLATQDPPDPLDDARPLTFFRGNPAYDKERGGFEWRADRQPPSRSGFRFETTRPGNSNQGHNRPNQVIDNVDDRKKVIAYLLTL